MFKLRVKMRRGQLQVVEPWGRERGMANEPRVTLEVGPKDKKVAAVAPDWPGLERGGPSGEAAVETLRAYLPRYAKVAKLAGMDAEFVRHQRRRRRAVPGYRLNRLLGHLVRVFEHRSPTDVERGLRT